MVFRLLVVLAFIARLLTGCGAGCGPAACAQSVAGDNSSEHDPGCGCCREEDRDDDCERLSLCCAPYQDPPRGASEPPCGCPGPCRHFCVGTQLFATGVQRCELPRPQTDSLTGWLPAPCLLATMHDGAHPGWSLELPQSRWADAAAVRAALQVYVL